VLRRPSGQARRRRHINIFRALAMQPAARASSPRNVKLFCASPESKDSSFIRGVRPSRIVSSGCFLDCNSRRVGSACHEQPLVLPGQENSRPQTGQRSVILKVFPSNGASFGFWILIEQLVDGFFDILFPALADGESIGAGR
jgi:hypothetical protein